MIQGLNFTNFFNTMMQHIITFSFVHLSKHLSPSRPPSANCLCIAFQLYDPHIVAEEDELYMSEGEVVEEDLTMLSDEPSVGRDRRMSDIGNESGFGRSRDRDGGDKDRSRRRRSKDRSR